MTNRIPTLDGLRAVAILTVIASHIWHDSMVGMLGQAGVLLFFALSGYLITTRLLDERAMDGGISLRNFYLRRAFRILPPALLYLVVLSALVALGAVLCAPSSIVAAGFFYVNYVDPGELGWRAGHFWSLSVEEHFYALWPLALIGFGVWRGWRTALALIVGVIVWRATDHHFHILERIFSDPHLHSNYSGTDVMADTLLWGCALAFVGFSMPSRVSVAITLIAAALLACIVMHVRLPPPHNIEFLTSLSHLLPTIILAAILAAPNSIIGRFLELAPMRYVGHLSYSLYIWQQLFLGGTGPKLPWAAGLAAAFACAYLSYRYIEQPSIAFGKQFISRPLRPVRA